MARGDWEHEMRGQYRRKDEAVVLMYLGPKRWIHGTAYAFGRDLWWKMYDERWFPTKEAAMDYADEHYPMEREG